MPLSRTASRLLTTVVTLSLAVSLALPVHAAPATPLPPTDQEAPARESPATGVGKDDSTSPVVPRDLPDADPTKAADVATVLRNGLDDSGNLKAEERVELSEQAYEALGREAADAQMGQGLKRLEETNDPQAPTLAELEVLAATAEDVAATGANDAQSEGPASGAGAEVRPEAAPAAGVPTFPEVERAALQIRSDPQDALRSWRPPGVLGVDVASHQGNVDWTYAWGQGTRFAYVKATQSWPSYAGLYKNPFFTQQYNGSASQGMVRGAYHFAMPAHSTGATQAKEFMDNGGGWSADGRTLPPLLDIEWNPYSSVTYPEGKGDMCFGLAPAQMVAWIQDFGNTVKARTGRLPMIYTAQSWWDVCTGDSTAFKGWPLHVALYPTATNVPKNPRELPEGWTTFSVWQYTSNADLIGSTRQVDGNVWNGNLRSLQDFATNRSSTPHRLTTDYLGSFDVSPTRLAPVRLSGPNRIDTAVEISRKTFPSAAPAVVVASAADFPDALSGSSLAVAKNAPLLLTGRIGVPEETLAEVRRLAPQAIYVLGSTAAVGAGAASQLAAIAPVTRLQGANRYGTAKDISDTWTTASTVFMATGQDYPDALSLAAVAAQRKQPLLLTQKGGLPSVTLSALKRLGPQTVVIAGSSMVVSENVVSQIRAAVPGVVVTRESGPDRYATSAAIANTYFATGSQRQFFATGSNFPDGLTGAVAAAYNDAPLLLTRPTCMPATIADSLNRMQGWTNVLLGSNSVISATGVYSSNGRPNAC